MELMLTIRVLLGFPLLQSFGSKAGSDIATKRKNKYFPVIPLLV